MRLPVEVRGQHARVGSFPPPCGSQGSEETIRLWARRFYLLTPLLKYRFSESQAVLELSNPPALTYTVSRLQV